MGSQLTIEQSVGDCLSEPPAPRCQGDTLVTFVEPGTADSRGCMIYGREENDCGGQKGKACTAWAGYGTSDRVQGTCNGKFGCAKKLDDTEEEVAAKLDAQSQRLRAVNKA